MTGCKQRVWDNGDMLRKERSRSMDLELRIQSVKSREEISSINTEFKRVWLEAKKLDSNTKFETMLLNALRQSIKLTDLALKL